MRLWQILSGRLLIAFLATVPPLLIPTLLYHRQDHSVTAPFYVNFANGAPALAVETTPSTATHGGAGVNLRLFDPNGKEGIALSSGGTEKDEHHRSITLNDPEGKPSLELTYSRYGRPGIQLYYPTGKKSFEITQSDSGVGLTILGPDSSGTLELRYNNFPADGGGLGTLIISNQRGDRTIHIGGGDMTKGGGIDVFERGPRHSKGRWISLESMKGANRLVFHPDSSDRAELELKSDKSGSKITSPDKPGKSTIPIP